MKINRDIGPCWLFVLSCICIYADENVIESKYYIDGHSLIAKKNSHLTKPTNFFAQALSDIGNMYKNLIHWDSYKTIATTFPIYIAARMADQSLHECFYDKAIHKHINTMPRSFHFFADRIAIAIEGVASAGFFLFSHNVRLRETSKMFLLGLPFVILTADLLKVIFKSEFCYRPLHEEFCKNHKRVLGGFPSTHAAQVTYATVVYGMQYGVKAAVPLALLGAAVVLPFINDNRHYLSQIVAGTGLGVLYGLAATKVIDNKFKDTIDVSLSLDAKHNPSISLGYKF